MPALCGTFRRAADGSVDIIPASDSRWYELLGQSGMAHAPHQLVPGDTVKLAACSLRVRAICADTEGQHVLQRVDTPAPGNDTPDDAAMCYICYDEANEDDHQLIRSPCACQTIVHKHCLAQWIESKHSHECSICKASLPPGVTTPAPYIMLQVTRHMRGLDWTGPREFTLSFQGTQRDMLIGSGSADVRMPDPSMSRQHAWLRFRDGHFELEDAGSSSGSYKLVRQACCLERGTQQQFKVGRTQLSLHIARASRESSSSAEASVACEDEATAAAATAAAVAGRLLHGAPARAPGPGTPGTPAYSMFTVTPATSVGDFGDE